MADAFFERPILNSPYLYPGRHWELDADGQPTNRILETRRRSELITPVPKPKKRRKSTNQTSMVFDAGDDLSSNEQEYNPTPIINELRTYVETWRNLRNPEQWLVTPETARLLKHWRSDGFQGIRPFFCQIEAVETAIWLTEVAPKMGPRYGKFWDAHRERQRPSEPGTVRLALKLATGAGKTTVMAMIIAWQAINAARHPSSKTFSRGFLVVAPGITIRDRLRVLQPNDPDSYYRHREIVPPDMLGEIDRAKIVITNYHAFKLRERMEVAKGTRQAIEGWRGEKLQTLETEGQMLQRVMPGLMGMKNIVVLNDEAHHCYRERMQDAEGETEADLKGEDKDEAKENNEAARMWISGLEIVKRKLGVSLVYDLSATPFFLRGSGYRRGHALPVDHERFLADGRDRVRHRQIAARAGRRQHSRRRHAEVPQPVGHDRQEDAEKGQGLVEQITRSAEPSVELLTALDALYGHYEKTFNSGATRRSSSLPSSSSSATTPRHRSSSTNTSPATCGRTTTERRRFENGRLALFRNFDEHGNPYARPNTILIDSAQLESGEALDKDFRAMAENEIEQFRREIIERTRDVQAGDKIDDATLLREVMNTVGKDGKLGEQIRCVVSVSMLTEGWDANTVTHILGVRAFGTQLLCEQVVGRGLRRQSYDLNEESLFNAEYADILGIPFDFAAKPVIAPAGKPRETDPCPRRAPRSRCAGNRFSRVEGYRVELPEERLDAKFGPNSVLESDAGTRRAIGHREPGYYRRGRRSHPRSSRGHAPVDGPVPPRRVICSTTNIATPARSRSCICSAS